MSYEESAKGYILNEYEEKVTELENKITELENKASVEIPKTQAQLLFKIQKVKNKLNQQNLKMTGWNDYKEYNYFELADFIPCTVKLMEAEKLASTFYTENQKMYLMITDAETGAIRTWSTPLKASNHTPKPSKDIGVLMKNEQALQTYARRTLWLQVLELVEPNIIEQETNKPVKKTVEQEKTEDIKLPDKTPAEVVDVFQKIQQDFKKANVPVNKNTCKNKLTSMLNSKKIDKETYELCNEVLNDG